MLIMIVACSAAPVASNLPTLLSTRPGTGRQPTPVEKSDKCRGATRAGRSSALFERLLSIASHVPVNVECIGLLGHFMGCLIHCRALVLIEEAHERLFRLHRQFHRLEAIVRVMLRSEEHTSELQSQSN